MLATRDRKTERAKTVQRSFPGGNGNVKMRVVPRVSRNPIARVVPGQYATAPSRSDICLSCALRRRASFMRILLKGGPLSIGGLAFHSHAQHFYVDFTDSPGLICPGSIFSSSRTKEKPDLIISSPWPQRGQTRWTPIGATASTRPILGARCVTRFYQFS